MEFMLDTLNLADIEKWAVILPLAGVTSNPSIAKKEGKTIFQVAPNCRASEDYKNLIEEITNKIIKLNN